MFGKGILVALALALMKDGVLAFTAPSTIRTQRFVRPVTPQDAGSVSLLRANTQSENDCSLDEADIVLFSGDWNDRQDDVSRQLALMVPACAASLAASPAEAAGDVIPSALWAYAHFASMLGAMGIVVGQRFVVKPGMTEEDESVLGKLNIAYGVFLTLILVSGYFRFAEFGKGPDFYSHEILFWLKMSNVGVLAGLALFPTVILVTRGMNKSPYSPMSDALVERMGKVLNAAITGYLFIPFFASFMARGVAYVNDFPPLAGVVFTVLATGGASFFYGKQSLTWQEPRPSIQSPPSSMDES